MESKMKDNILAILGLLAIAFASYMGVRSGFKTLKVNHIITVQVEMPEGGDYGYYQNGKFVPACTDSLE